MRVAAVPAVHPYVVAVTEHDRVAVLPDPVPDPAHPERWWPPLVLDAAWIRANADRFDLVHVHFGMESLPEGRLAAALDALDALGKPLVYTVHDLQNPQLDDQSAHRRDLDLVISRAAALLTLTPQAGAEVRRTWGREARVLGHPTLLPAGGALAATCDDVAGEPGTTPPARVIGVHLRDLRPNIDALAAVRSLLAGLDALAQAGILASGRVLRNATTRDPALELELAAALRDRADCELLVRERPDDDALLAEIDALDVALLPYRHGTHSGWLELCYDRGVSVVGPDWLAMAGQHPDAYLGLERDGDPGPVVLEAVQRATRPRSAARRRVVADRSCLRRAERTAIAHAHHELYRELVAQTGARR